ncbi:DUF4118 domain-containing protein [Falsiroseomonas ponticola]|jgi:K+-sensing histidine kinase KdpD|uniref:DUF4118 domain-containing protein n=1 Tax=Falsiroseomonas ponticola TaxID=2786951 RepID=UPI001934502A|nr:DUF4118 domain-containing protein [Roseomonas ponticola]
MRGGALLALRRLALPRRCLLAIAVILAAFALRAAVGGWHPGFPFLPFLPAVVLATVALGLGPGLLTAVLGWALAVIFFVEPVGRPAIDDWADLAFAVFFPAAAAFAAVVVEVFLAAAGIEAETPGSP